jgi:hypothetical protein
MIHRQKFHVDLLEGSAPNGAPSGSNGLSENAACSDALLRAPIASEARTAFVDSLKAQIETDDYCIDSFALAHCLQKAPLTNAVLLLNVDKAICHANDASPT